MSEQMQILFLGALLSALGIMVWSKLRQVDDLRSDISNDRLKLENRLTTLEQQSINLRESLDNLATVTEKRFVLVGGAVLHSPDNHLNADPEIERFVTLYVMHHGEMPHEEGSDWAYWRKFFFHMTQKPEATPNEKMLAMGYKELCEHKLLKSGLLDVTIKKQNL